MKISIIIPVHNEEQFVGETLQSLVNQQQKPNQIILVDDHSTDRTPEILQAFAQKYPFIQLVKHTSSQAHLPGAKVVNAFNAGLAHLQNPDVVCKFDADLIFPDNYLKNIVLHYSQNPKLGMYGGVCIINKDGSWAVENLTNKDHIRGGLKSYRMECFRAIGGLKNAMGWDTADELLARYYGWEVSVDESLKVKHLRPTGAGYNKASRYLQGGMFYAMRYGLVLSVLASLKLAYKKKKASLFADYLLGYFKARKERQPFLVDAPQGKWIRAYRWRGILSKIF